MTSSALFSPDRKYRYWLLRQWDASKPIVAFVLLNPSTAAEVENDPTVRRCIGFAKLWGFGGVLVLNMYAFRATLPRDMWHLHQRGGDIVGGPENYVSALQGYCREFGVEKTIAGWGSDRLERHLLLSSPASQWKLDCLKKNADGQPAHPLYLPYSLAPQPWNYSLAISLSGD